MFKCKLFVDGWGGTPSEGVSQFEAYRRIEKWLLTFCGSFEFERNIRPYQLSYRDFDCYLIDIGGLPETSKKPFLSLLGDVIRSRPSRLYLFWTGETWEAFANANPLWTNYTTCINCCNTEAIDNISLKLLDLDAEHDIL